MLDARLEQLRYRFSFDLPKAQSLSPQLPVIPLPIDVAGLQASLPERAVARDLPRVAQRYGGVALGGATFSFHKVRPLAPVPNA